MVRGGGPRGMIGQWLDSCVWEGERDGGYELAAFFFSASGLTGRECCLVEM